jgi:hypothetical protein
MTAPDRKAQLDADTAVRNNPSLRGRPAYEASLKACPTYHTGETRKTWDELGSDVKMTWGIE